MKWCLTVLFAGACVLLIATSSAGAELTVTLVPSMPSGAPVATQVVWTASVNPPSALTRYRFGVRPAAGSWRVVRDFGDSNSLEWTTLEEGRHEVFVTAVDHVTGQTAQHAISFDFASRVPRGSPAVFSTVHPLVALYSAPPCSAGSLSVRFRAAGKALWQTTPAKPCQAGRSTSFYVAGMRANTNYVVQQILDDGDRVVPGPLLSFRSGSVTFPVAPFVVTTPPDQETSMGESILLWSSLIGGSTPPLLPVATDLLGNVLWFYDKYAEQLPIGNFLLRPVPGGSFLMAVSAGARGNLLREIDVVGNVVRETNLGRVNAQLVAMGQDPVNSFNHEAVRLENGHTLIVASVERILVDVQGPGPVDVLGDIIVDLNEDFQVVWSWNTFDFLDQGRKATLDEKCLSTTRGCPPMFLADSANDWTHTNSIQYLPEDGNLLVSVRHQDWVLKIDYRNGAGSGDIIWRMGNGGDFTMLSNDPWPWFSHQHDVEFDGGVLTVYDNGNPRIFEIGGRSRGQALLVNETSRVAELVLNVSFPYVGWALGSAQRLSNGNYHFATGVLRADRPDCEIPLCGNSHSVEVRPDGSSSYGILWNSAAYRSFRMRDLYTP